jgi:hypothetical protein
MNIKHILYNHIEYVTSAAYKSLGFVLRNRRLFHSAEAIVSLYKAYVRCKLEYAGIVWSPIYRVSINDCLVKPALEKKFTVPLF